MRRLLLVVEGATERGFLEKLLGGPFVHRGLAVSARIVGKPGRKGGDLSIDRVLCDVVGLLKQEPNSIVTTCFDYYGLKWDFAITAKSKAAPQAVLEIEAGLTSRVADKLSPSSDPKRFVPYVQLHELEAIFFAQPEAVAGAFGSPELAGSIQAIVDKCGGCEAINDHFETTPARRLQGLFPGYRKGASDQAHAPRIADRMSLEIVRGKCPHFSAWLAKLEALGTA